MVDFVEVVTTTICSRALPICGLFYVFYPLLDLLLIWVNEFACQIGVVVILCYRLYVVGLPRVSLAYTRECQSSHTHILPCVVGFVLFTSMYFIIIQNYTPAWFDLCMGPMFWKLFLYYWCDYFSFISFIIYFFYFCVLLHYQWLNQTWNVTNMLLNYAIIGNSTFGNSNLWSHSQE